MTPNWRLQLNGQTVRPGHLQSLTLIDKRGLQADELSLVLADSQHRLRLPTRGDTFQIALGWQSQPLVDKGRYQVQTSGHSGPPSQINVQALSAEQTAGLWTQQERAFHATTLGAILHTIATAHGLQARVHSRLAAMAIAHLDQTFETDANLITRLGQQHDALASVKNGYLLFMPLGQGQTVSGQPLPTHLLQPQAGDRHQFSEQGQKGRVTGVQATYHEWRTRERGQVVAGDAGYLRTLKNTYPTEAEARQAAQAEWNRLQRGQYALTLDLAVGVPHLIPEQPVQVSGWHPVIDTIPWVIRQITHTLNDQGYTNSLALERLG